MPVAPPAQYGIDCAIARRGNTRNSGHGYCPKGQYAVLGAAIACSNTPLFAPIAPAGAIGLGLRYCPTGQYAQLGTRLLPKRAIRRAWRGYCLQQYAALCAYCATGAIGLGLRYCPMGQYAQLGARLLPKRQYAAPAFCTREPYSGFASCAFAFFVAISMINSTSF